MCVVCVCVWCVCVCVCVCVVCVGCMCVVCVYVCVVCVFVCVCVWKTEYSHKILRGSNNTLLMYPSNTVNYICTVVLWASILVIRLKGGT